MTRMAEPSHAVALPGVPSNAPLGLPSFSAFAPDKAAWKELPGNRYTPAELRAMEEQWRDLEIFEPLEPVHNAD